MHNEDSQILTQFTHSAFRKIELVWPGKDKDFVPRQLEDGEWHLQPRPSSRIVRPLENFKYPVGTNGVSSLVISGDRMDSLEALGRCLARRVKLAYLDMPRVEVDDKEAVFKGDPTLIYSTWMTVFKSHLESVEPLVTRDGVVIVHVGDNEEAMARLIADEVFGRTERVGTIVWQRSYSPRNPKHMRELTATHDCLLIYAKDKESLASVGLKGAPEGFNNPDGDPRGNWKAEHKGAHSYRAKSNFNTFLSPYRWRIAEGRLPKGLWRLNPLTGVIWGRPEEVGTFAMRIEIADSVQETLSRDFAITVSADGQASEPSRIPWLFSEMKTTGPLRIVNDSLPVAKLNEEYFALCLGAGGQPFKGPPKRPTSGRYWEFADDTLMAAYQNDSVYLGKDGKSIPHPKTYSESLGDIVITNQTTWWPGRVSKGTKSSAFAGYTEDATKHLKKLAELNLIQRSVNTAKPEPLLARLLNIFTEPNDLILETFGEAADLSAVSIKLGRRFVYLSGITNRQRELLSTCAIPRLKAVVNGNDDNLENGEGEIRMRSDAYIPYAGGGCFVICELGSWLLKRDLGQELPILNRKEYQTRHLCEAILSADGFLPAQHDRWCIGRSLDGKEAGIVIEPETFFSSQLAAELASTVAPDYEALTVYFFRSSDDLDRSTLPRAFTTRRVPSEIAI
jgi:hypothetical protein